MFNFLKNLFKPQNHISENSFANGFGYSESVLTASDAAKQVTFYTCVKIISESISQMPLILYKRGAGGRRRAEEHNLYKILKTAPNHWQSASEFWHWIVENVLTHGVAYAQIVRVGSKVMGLYPIPRFAISEQWNGNEVSYYVTLEGNRQARLSQKDVLAVRGETSDGKRPVSPIWILNKSLYLAIQAEKFGSKFFSNNASPGGLLETDQILKKEVVDDLKKGWQENYSGDNMHSIAVLSGGLKFKPVTMTAEAAQFLQTRNFQRSEICSAFRVPLFMVGDNSTSNWGTGIEQQTMGFITFTLGNWMTRIQQSVERDLLNTNEQDEYYCEFLTEALLKGDLASRVSCYKTALGGNQMPGYMTINEVRIRENFPPVDGGDVLYKPLTGEVDDNESEDSKTVA